MFRTVTLTFALLLTSASASSSGPGPTPSCVMRAAPSTEQMPIIRMSMAGLLP